MSEPDLQAAADALERALADPEGVDDETLLRILAAATQLSGTRHAQGSELGGAREVRVGEHYDTRETLRNAQRQAEERGLDRLLIVDADSHHYETESWEDVTSY